MSCRSRSAHNHPQISRDLSRASRTLPNFLIAARRASSGSIPASMFSWISKSMWASISSFNTSPRFFDQVIAGNPFRVTAELLAFLRERGEDPPDRFREPMPPRGLRKELSVAFLGESIKPGLAVVLRCAVFGNDKAVFDEPLQCGIQGAVPHLQHLARAVFDGSGNGVPVHWAQDHRLQNQQVKRALQESGLVVRLSSRHSTCG